MNALATPQLAEGRQALGHEGGDGGRESRGVQRRHPLVESGDEAGAVGVAAAGGVDRNDVVGAQGLATLGRLESYDGVIEAMKTMTLKEPG